MLMAVAKINLFIVIIAKMKLQLFLRRTKMNRVIIELEFDDKPTDADVYNYLNELMDNDCLGYEIKETEND
jgi:hypothetical protein